MRSKVFLLILPLCTVLVSGTPCFGWDYTVKKWDCLSSIALHNLHGAVWGSQGSVKRILDANPNIRSTNLIYIGQVIAIPEAKSLAQNAVVQAPSSNEEIKAQDFQKPVLDQSASAPALPVLAPVQAASVPAPPVPAQTAPSAPEFHQGSLFEITPEFYFSRIDSRETSNGASAILGSGLNYGIDAAWILRWSEGFDSSVNFGVHAENYQQEDSNRPLSNSSFAVGEFSLRGNWHFASASTLGFEIGMKELPYTRGNADNSITIDRNDTPDAGVSLNLVLVRGEVLSFGLVGQVDALAPTVSENYSTKLGTDASLKLEFAQISTHTDAKGGLFFESIHQNSNITTQSTTMVGAYIGVAFDAFSRKEK